MKFLEKTLEDIIYSNLLRLKDRGLDFLRPNRDLLLVRRQVQLGSYGVADLIVVELVNDGPWRTLYINIIECKLGAIDINAYQQVHRYKTAIQCILRHYNLRRTEVEIRTILIGSDMITSGDFPFVLNSDHNCDCYTYSYDFDGVQFTKKGKFWTRPNASLPIDSIGDAFLEAYKAVKRIAKYEEAETLKCPF